MRVFATYRNDGEIVSVAKMEVIPEGLDHPFGTLGEGESVVEVPPTAELEEMGPLEIVAAFKVNVAEKKLIKK